MCLDSADSEVNEELKKEKIAELKKKEKSLQDLLTEKLTELKKLCLREAVSVFFFPASVACFFFPLYNYIKLLSFFLQELTGKLPKEYPLASGEKPPPVRRRVGTAFKLDDLFPYDAVCPINIHVIPPPQL